MAAVHPARRARPVAVPVPIPESYGRGLSAVVFAPITALFGMAFDVRIGLVSAALVAWVGVVVMLFAELQRRR